MDGGSNGKIMRVDLTASSIRAEEFDEAFCLLFPGGEGLAGEILLSEMPLHAAPLGSEFFYPCNWFIYRGTLVDKANAARLRPQDISNGTFTISNLGMFSMDAFLAIINAP